MQDRSQQLDRGRYWLLLVALLALSSLPLVAGCGGCRSDPPPDQVELDKKKKPKPDFELTRLYVLPAAVGDDDEDEQLADELAEPAVDEEPGDDSAFDSMAALSQAVVKPGHWAHLRYRLRANNFDFIGELKSGSLDRDLLPVPLPRTQFRVLSARPTALPKQQLKYVETPLFIPEIVSEESRAVQIGARLESRSGSRVVDFGGRPTVRLNAHQHVFIVLSDNPERYGYLKTLTAIRPPDLGESEWDFLPGDYAVVFIDGAQPVPVASHALAWTTTAYAVWDDYDPEALSGDQQTALLDWLHWGGRLIISGPKSLDRLRGSFLEPYLPATAGRTVNATDAAIQTIDEQWTLMPSFPRRPAEAYELRIGPQPMEIVELNLNDRGRFAEHTADLIAQRRVGRGQIVTSAFALTDRQWVNWPAFDSFFSNCLMRRSPRKFGKQEGYAAMRWVDSKLRRNPFMTCGLRYFSRDANTFAGDEISFRGDPQGNGFVSNPVSGVAGWTDFSAVAEAARQSLRPAAGIAVPERAFVARTLGCYLLCLVPLNWLLFRLFGRVEWAWFAAPLIAIVGGITIVRVAQLDIGFARARSELVVMELQPDYDRAHVTRYAGLYTSLSSRYAAEFEDAGALAMPFSTAPSDDQLRLQVPQDVEFRRDSQVGMSGFPVLSNSTGMIHAEQMVDVGGTVKLIDSPTGAQQVVNETTSDFAGSFLIQRQTNGSCRVALVGPLAAGAAAELSFEKRGEIEPLLEYFSTQPAVHGDQVDGQLSLRKLIEVAIAWQQLAVGEFRFVGWNDTEVPGMTVRPRSSQSTFRTLLIGNLAYAPLPAAQPDINLVESFLPMSDSAAGNSDDPTDDEALVFPPSG